MSSQDTEKGERTVSSDDPDAPADNELQQQQSASHPTSCTREELTELVRAIKFAKPDASMRAVHKEITHDLAQKEGFGFLKDITLNDVKKVWKKALSGGNATSTSSGNTSAATTQPPPDAKQAAVADLVQATTADDGVVKLYTVGDGSVRMLAQEYSQALAAQEAAAAAQQQQENERLLQQYVHVFLDVPADPSGARGHQATISLLNDSKSSAKQNDDAGDKGEIVKIQMAAANEGDDDAMKHPMLLYNQDRSARTFIHPDPHSDGYERIQKWIREKGVGGALGMHGGMKAYFYSRITKRRKGHGPKDVISIDMSEIAPVQDW